MMVREWVLWQYWDCFPTVKCRVEAFATGGLIDCEKSVCESRESQRECDTLSQLQSADAEAVGCSSPTPMRQITRRLRFYAQTHGHPLRPWAEDGRERVVYKVDVVE